MARHSRRSLFAIASTVAESSPPLRSTTAFTGSNTTVQGAWSRHPVSGIRHSTRIRMPDAGCRMPYHARTMADLNVYEVLNRKRRGAPLDAREIEIFIDRFTSGDIPDYQMSALLLAIAINGMTSAEMATLTQAMLRSGEQWHLRDRYDFIADKHSTGGVGDKVSLVLTPWVASCGLKIG